MARDRQQSDDFVSPVRRLLVGLLVLFLLATFLIWRIDNPRVERFRMMVIDSVVPSFDWAMAPVTGIVNLLSDFQS
ncbi:rod shape-determining protein MreC, partial [Octadecabacter sp.]|nr:rod shape-determining protein MreC [Octadecabacter sp.]